MATIRGRIMDEASARPLAARVTVLPLSGRAPGTRYPRWPGFSADGEFEAEAPAGPARVEVRKGPEWHVHRQTLEVPADGVADVALGLSRWVDMAARGWYGGDNHVHPIHGERDYEADLALVALACRAEGLHYASAAQSWGRAYALDELKAECRHLSRDDFTIYWNLEFPKTQYGHVWHIGASDFQHLADGPANYPGLARLRAEGAVACIAHPLRWWHDAGDFVTNMAAELPFDLAAGLVDAIDVMYDRADDPKAQALWFLLLNIGYRLPGLAASDACLDRPAGPIPGRFRTYAHIEGEFTIAKAAQALRRGQCFVTSGPFVLFDVDGNPIGEELEADGRQREAHIEAYCSGEPDERLREVQLIRGGGVVRTWKPDARCFAASYPIEERETSWYVVKCRGEDGQQVAFTNPVYFRAPGFERPQPVVTRLTVQATNERGEALNGRLHVLDPLGTVSEQRIFEGSAEVHVPPTAAVRVGADGYESATKRVFEGTPLHDLVQEIADGTWQERPLLERYTYERVRKMASAQTLRFVLRPRAKANVGEEKRP